MTWIDKLAVRWLLWRKIPVVMNVTFEGPGIQAIQSEGAIVIRNSMAP